jgi:predicted metal-dependent hydrolase
MDTTMGKGCETMYPEAYIRYLIHFHTDRDYFECHEILEEHWKKDGYKKVWVALIQIAVALYHHRRGNDQGALRMMQKARSLIEKEQQAIHELGLDEQRLAKQLERYMERIVRNKAYESIELPIRDETLRKICQTICEKQGLTWGQASDLNNAYLIHKHKLRDRTEVIAARERKRKSKELPDR